MSDTSPCLIKAFHARASVERSFRQGAKELKGPRKTRRAA